jgi:hypothetical protein
MKTTQSENKIKINKALKRPLSSMSLVFSSSIVTSYVKKSPTFFKFKDPTHSNLNIDMPISIVEN